jgi:hypothetical protein
MAGQVVRREYELDLTLTSPRQEFALQTPRKNIAYVQLLGYEIRGPLLGGGGIPVEHSYYLELPGLGMVERLAVTGAQTGNAYPLPLTGDVSRHRYVCPEPVLVMASGVGISSIVAELKTPSGAPATFTQATLYLRFVVDNAEYSKQELISFDPRSGRSYQHSFTQQRY